MRLISSRGFQLLKSLKAVGNTAFKTLQELVTHAGH